MTSVADRYRHVWLGWWSWSPFRLMARAMMLWWLLTLADARLSIWIRDIEDTFRYGPVKPRTAPMWAHHVHDFFTTWVGVPLDRFPVLLLGAAPLLIVWRIRRQMSDWRSSLMPNYRRTHLLVAGIISAAIFLMMAIGPEAFNMQQWWDLLLKEGADPHMYFRQYWNMEGINQYGFPVWYFTRVLVNPNWALLIAALIGWLAASVSSWTALAVVFGCGMVVGWLGWGTGAIDTIRNSSIDDDPGLILRFFLFDLLLIFSLWLRLWKTSSAEDAISADERAPWLSRILTTSDRGMPRGWMQAGLWERARHRRLMGLGHRFVWIVAIYLAVLNGLTPLLGVYPALIEHNGYAFGAVQLAAMICSLAVGFSWPRRLAALGEVELLRPARREIFAQEIGLAMLSDAVEICLATLLAMLVPIAIWAPGAFATARFWIALIAAILAQAMVFGIIVWTMRRQSMALSIGALLVTMLGGMLLINTAWNDRQLIPSLCAAAVGIALAVHSYRGWQQVDLL